MVYFPDAELSDGAAEVYTDGLFDVFNAPPWDTWVALFEEGPQHDRSYGTYLVAYIPQPLLSLAERGISVNPERCIDWLERTQVKLVSRLREAGVAV